MMANQKEQAEVLRHGLLAGVCTVADVVAWADGIIAADSKPDIAVIEVSTSGLRRTADVIALLREVPGECDPVIVIRRAMANLRSALAANPARGPEIARWLYQLATSGELPEEHFGQEAYALEDWFALASSGTYGTYADALRHLEAYLERHARRH